MKVYEGRYNSDSNEGRGITLSSGLYTSDEAAYESIKGRGIWGSNGDVYAIEVRDTFARGEAKPADELVYGWVPNRPGSGAGQRRWVDGRDLPPAKVDPEWAEFLRLRDKFKDVR